MTDADSATLSVFDGPRNKTVSFYYGCLGESGDVSPDKAVKTVSKGLLPPAPHDISLLADFAIHVDSVAGTDEWAPLPRGARTKPLHNYVFIAREREVLRSKPAFLTNRNFEGVQITYPWAQLERARDEYDFSAIREDLALLESKNKKLWIQLSDVSFTNAWTNVPAYLTSDTAYHGGVAKQYSIPDDDESKAKPAGYVARRWDPAVQAQFQKLLFALGREFDGKVEGINLPETPMTFGSSGKLFPAGFVQKEYPAVVAINLKALKLAFPKSIAMQYANFMPGEWRPTEDKLYLARVYGAAKNANVGVGGPDSCRSGRANSRARIRSFAGQLDTSPPASLCRTGISKRSIPTHASV